MFQVHRNRFDFIFAWITNETFFTQAAHTCALLLLLSLSLVLSLNNNKSRKDIRFIDYIKRHESYKFSIWDSFLSTTHTAQYKRSKMAKSKHNIMKRKTNGKLRQFSETMAIFSAPRPLKNGVTSEAITTGDYVMLSTFIIYDIIANSKQTLVKIEIEGEKIEWVKGVWRRGQHNKQALFRHLDIFPWKSNLPNSKQNLWFSCSNKIVACILYAK